jgi:ankyrin repeat protein
MDESLRKLVDAIVANREVVFSRIIEASPALATATFQHGATRQGSSSPGSNFLVQIGHYINSGDTALHFAAASYRPEMANELIKAGAQVRAKNRRGTEPLHLAAVGGPNSPRWNPPAQSATIVCLIKAGADPNAKNKDGTTPLHRASGRGVLTRSGHCLTTGLIRPSAPKMVRRHCSLPCTRRGEAVQALLKRKLSNKRFCFCSKGDDREITVDFDNILDRDTE